MTHIPVTEPRQPGSGLGAILLALFLASLSLAASKPVKLERNVYAMGTEYTMDLYGPNPPPSPGPPSRLPKK